MRVLVSALCVLVAAPAAAQSTFLGVSVVGDIARFGRTELDGAPRILIDPEPLADGDAFGFAISAGRRLGSRWGVELEFARPGRIEREAPARLAPQPLAPAIPSEIILVPIPDIFPLPPLVIARRIDQRHTTLTPALFFDQELGDRVVLSYSAGPSFSRVESRRSVSASLARPLPVPIGLPSVVLPDTAVVEYGVGPMAGIAAAVSLWEHVAIVGGVRLHGISIAGHGGWLIRPHAGARWRF